MDNSKKRSRSGAEERPASVLKIWPVMGGQIFSASVASR